MSFIYQFDGLIDEYIAHANACTLAFFVDQPFYERNCHARSSLCRHPGSVMFCHQSALAAAHPK
jgi:hypothetical protein